MIDGIDFYLMVLKRISSLYNGNEDELCISEKLVELMKELKESHEDEQVKKAIRFILKVFESYYYDDYNASQLSSGAQDQTLFNQTLVQEVFNDNYNSSSMVDLNKIPSKEKIALIDILKEELNS
jgi:coenzyme F420-reducing hydrogenase alpha subunit